MASDTAAQQKRRRAKQQAREAMERAARAKKPITYHALVDDIDALSYNPNAQALTDLLCEISRATEAKAGVLLSAVVVRKDLRRPGPGFFTFAASLGRRVADEVNAWEREVELVYAAYGSGM